MYTLVSASVLALDLVRHPSGAAVADVLDRALALDTAAQLDTAVPLAVVDLERAAARERLLAVAASAPRIDDALRAVSRSLGTADGSVAAQVLSAALVGRLTDLVVLLERELGQERGLPRGVVDVVVDRAVAAWVQTDDATRRDDVDVLSAPFCDVVGELPAPLPEQGAVHQLLVLLEAVARCGPAAWSALDDAHAAAHPGLQWSELVHAASRAAVESGRTVEAARWQLSAVRAAHSAVRPPGTSPGAAMSLVGAVQALAVADVLPTAVVEPLLAPARLALALPC